MAEAAVPQTLPPRAARGLAQLQAKLEVGAANDHFEREADHVASQVMRGGDGPVSIPPTITPIGAQRKAAPQAPKEEEKPRAKPAKAQRKANPSMREDEPKGGAKAGKVQRDAAAGAAGGTASPSVANAISAMQAGSAPGLDGGARGFMQNRFGRDFSGVRVHHGERAAAAADALGARAFTIGNDVFFNRGQYQPHSSSGRQLLAHELTHTVQQQGSGGVAARKRIQRDPEDEAAPVPPGTAAATPTQFDIPSIPGARIDTNDTGGAKGTITVPTLALPAVAGAHKGTAGGIVTPVADSAAGRAIPVLGSSLTFNKPMPHRDRDSVPAEVWTASARGDANIQAGIKDKLNQKIAATPDAASIVENGVPVYYLKLPRGTATNVFIGTVDELAQSDALVRPQWSSAGDPLFDTNRFDADHFLEMQLGGADTGANMWLLQASYNRSVGSQIAANMRTDINAIISQAERNAAIPTDQKPKELEVRTQWNVVFTRVVAGNNFSGRAPTFWTRAQIQAGAHLDPLRVMNEADMVAAGLRLAPGQQPTRIKVFPSAAGELAKTLQLGANGNVRRPPRGELFDGIIMNSGTYIGNQPLDAPESDLMTLNVTILKTRESEGAEVIDRKTGDVAVKRAPRLGIAGYISRASIVAAARTTRFKPLSPLTFDDIGVSPEGVLSGTGSIGSTKLMLPGLNVPISLYGDRVGINFPVPVENLSLGPVSITEAGLSLGVGERGFFLEGYAGFEIRSLGSGMVTAALTEAGPELSGNFNLAMDFFNPASIAATYNLANDAFTAQATLGVQQGRIPGVDSGTVTVTLTRDTIGVNGTINLGGPLRGTVVNVTYTETEGLKIGADNIPLPFANLPAVQNATLSVSASKPPNAENWSFAGHGTATLAVPGATGTLDIDYLDGAVTLHGTGTVARGPASGTLDFTATNRQIDEQGRPIEGPPTDAINAWGRGSVTVRFGETLTGTAGVEYTPDNRVIITGTIAMPPVYEVFPRRDFNRDLFTLSPPEFPIWGVSVAGYGVGIFAFVDARVFFEAYVGPGQIRDASVTATLDLDRPEEATVHGHGEFYVPAYAGLGLDVGGGLRARLAVAYAQGRVGLTGRLGVEAGAGAIVDFDWNRADGLSLTADLHAEATPKFDLFATASVTVGVDLLLTEVEHTWGPWRRQLGSFGPDMTLGVHMPVRWSEAGGLDLSMDNIEVTRPQLDAGALMSDVFSQLAG
ncbi:DUF4157 domain-containing protein [Sphingomonas sp. MMS12-HWE2-04]|uniref:eCIS core domain-containing protein n=1 Tax=Sphingomonas sp. MMS12-HWE2-04 TaxID=3234199 RepID=UPI00384ABFFD